MPLKGVKGRSERKGRGRVCTQPWMFESKQRDMNFREKPTGY